ncbi:MAG: nicotinate (nicotinamide) nucleotide adenylyltransferase [Myxococcaceae bacterium]
MKIGLIGGSFNPPHVGHLLAAQYVWATQPLDAVWLLPSFRHPFGKPLEAYAHRVAMCEALCADTSGWLSVSREESNVPGEGRTVDVLEHLAGKFPQEAFSWVMGSDIIADLPYWKDFERIKALARVLVIHRAGHPHPSALGPPLAEVSSTVIRERLKQGASVDDCVPRRVVEYIRQNGLYATGPE